MSWLGRSGWVLGVVVGLGFPEAARAQYRIEASGCGPQPAAVSTTEPNVSRLGGGSNQETGSYTQCSSAAGGVDGTLAASVAASFTGGPVGLMPVTSTAAFREQLWIDDLEPGQVAIVEATLSGMGAADVSGAPGTARASATLNVGGCRITRIFYSNGNVSDTPSCSGDSQAVGGPDGLFVTLVIPYESLGPSPLGNYVQMFGTLQAEVSSLAAPGVGLAEIAGQLGFSMSGDGTARFSNADSLSVPEPGPAAGGLAALAALAACARRSARRRRVSPPRTRA
jgi:hypothetical protein